MPESVRYPGFASGCRSRNSRSSCCSQASRAAVMRAITSGSNMKTPIPGSGLDFAPSDAISRPDPVFAVVDDAAGLELGPRQGAGRQELEPRADAEAGLEALAHLGLEGALRGLGGVGRRVLGLDEQVVHLRLARHHHP